VIGDGRLAFDAEAEVEGEIFAGLPFVVGVEAEIACKDNGGGLAGGDVELSGSGAAAGVCGGRLCGFVGGVVRKGEHAVVVCGVEIRVANGTVTAAKADKVLAVRDGDVLLKLGAVCIVVQRLRAVTAAVEVAFDDDRRRTGDGILVGAGANVLKACFRDHVFADILRVGEL